MSSYLQKHLEFWLRRIFKSSQARVAIARMNIFLGMAKIPIAISFLLDVLLDYARILMATFDLKMRRDAKHIREIQ